MAARRGNARGGVTGGRSLDPAAVVAGFLAALDEAVEAAAPAERPLLRLHAAYGLRRASERLRLDLICAGHALQAALDEALEGGADDVRRAYLARVLRGTQPGAEA